LFNPDALGFLRLILHEPVAEAHEMITVWGRMSSSNVQATLWCLAELGLEFDRIDAGFVYGVTDTPAYLEMNPNGFVPTLVDGENPPLFETGAILRYLATAYGDEVFWPSGLVARTRIDKWAEWAKINIALKFTAPIFWLAVRTASSLQDPEQIAANLDILNKFLSIADTRLAANAFIAGPDFTLADIQMGHCLFRYFDIDLPRASFPHLQAYYERLCSRPAYRRHVMVSYEELRVTEQGVTPLPDLSA
jgi:glutathione S-transferase